MTVESALKELIPGLQKAYGDLINSVILYGSTARGTREDDSDVDVAVLLYAGATKEMGVPFASAFCTLGAAAACFP